MIRRALGFFLALLLLTSTTVYGANTGLEAQIALVYGISRTIDPNLHSIAQQRAQYQVDFSGGMCYSDGSLTHAGKDGWYAEVLACNGTGIVRAVEQWVNSPGHHAILSNAGYNLIGCGIAYGSGGSIFYACTLATGPAPSTGDGGGSTGNTTDPSTSAPAPSSQPQAPQPQPAQTSTPSGTPDSEPETTEPIMMPDTAMEK